MGSCRKYIQILLETSLTLVATPYCFRTVYPGGIHLDVTGKSQIPPQISGAARGKAPLECGTADLCSAGRRCSPPPAGGSSATRIICPAPWRCPLNPHPNRRRGAPHAEGQGLTPSWSKLDPLCSSKESARRN